MDNEMLQTILSAINDVKKELKQDISEVKQDLSEVKQDLSELEQKVTRIGIKVENEVCGKLDALFDGYQQVYEKTAVLETDVAELKRKIS